VLLAWEGACGEDPGRALLARCVLAHRLAPRDPLANAEASWETPALALLLGEGVLTGERASALLAA